MHSWDLEPSEAISLQKKLSGKIICGGEPEKIKTIAGADLSFEKIKKLGFCSITLLRYPDLEVLKVYSYYGKVKFPYIPGLLSFREGPLFLKTFEKIKEAPDLIVFDGQGIAHPRRLGIASHMGLILDIPTIGCAKSRLTGEYKEPDIKKGDRSYLYDKTGKDILGIVLRTRDKVKPVFVSPGYKIGINESAEIIMNCVKKYRIPEPVRIADIEVGKYKRIVRRKM
jgi:deoxyribonuclease V